MTVSKDLVSIPSIGSDQTTVTVDVLHTGTVTIDRAFAYEARSRHPFPASGWFRPAEKRIQVPVSAYLITHPEGHVLVDTGWHTDVRTDERSHLGRLYSSMFQAYLPAGAAVTEQLAARDLVPADLHTVVISHFHPDHVSGLDLVRDAHQILASEPAYLDANRRLSLSRLLSGHMWDGINISPFGFDDTDLGPFGRSYDLFDDGSVYLVWAPGHDEGQIAVLSRTTAGWVVLASDVAYGDPSIEDGVLPGVTTDREAARTSLKWLRAIADRPECWAVLPNHDPAVRIGYVTS